MHYHGTLHDDVYRKRRALDFEMLNQLHNKWMAAIKTKFMRYFLDIEEEK